MKKKLRKVLLAVSVLTLWGHCAFAADGEEIVSAKDTLVIGLAREPVSLDPFETAGVEATRVKRQVMEGLFEITDSGEYVPLLATDWEWENDTTITFHLREGVTFSDGAPFSAEDVMYTIRKIKEKSPGGLIDQYIDMDQTEKVDDYTVKVVLTEPTPLLFDKFESQHFGVLHEESYENPDNDYMYKPLGTGPYLVESWNTGDSVTLVRNENYWGTPAYCEKVIYRLIPESAQRTIELEVGSIDVNLDMAFEDVEYFEDENLYTVEEYPVPTVNAMFYNMSDVRKSPVQNQLVRQAMAYAIDTEAISESVYGIGDAANSNLSPYYASLYNQDLTEDDVLYRYDLDKAKELMAEAGYADGFDLVMLLDEDPMNQSVAEIIQYQLSQLNINMEIVTRSSTTWFATVCAKEEYDLVMFVLYDNDPVWAWMHFLGDESFGSPDYTSYRNSEFMDTMHELAKTTDEAKKKELMTKMDALVTEDLPVYSIHFATNIVAMNKAVSNFEYRGGQTNANQIYLK